MTPEDEEFARIEAEINRRQGDTPPAAQPDYAWPTIEQRAVIQQMVDALDHADELLGGNDTLVMNGAAAGRWLLEQPAPVQEPEYWNVIDPAGNSVASETNAIRGWARIAGSYKPTVEGLLGFHDQGWRVLPKATPQPVPVKTYHDGKPWPVAPKPWVGLTDEEIQTTWDSVMDGAVFTRREIYKAIEAKLKEKNT